MNGRDPHVDPELERRVSAWLTESDLTDDEAQRGLDYVSLTYPTTPQHRRRLLDRVLDRDEGAPAPREDADPERGTTVTSGPSRLLLSTVVITAVLMLVVFGLGAMERDADLDAGPVFDGGMLSVGAGGLGDYDTIAAAVASAADGDTVLIRPGTYVETVIIDKRIQLLGNGPRDQVVIRSAADTPLATRCHTGDEREPPTCSIVVDHVDVTIAGLTFRGDGSGVAIFGGRPTLRDLTFEGVGTPVRTGLPGSGGPVTLFDGSTAVIRDSTFADSAGLEIRGGSSPTIERNELRGGTFIAALVAGDEAVIRENRIADVSDHAIELFSPTRMIIADNTIIQSAGPAIQVGGKFDVLATGIDPTIRGNTIVGGTAAGIQVTNGANPTIENNELLDNRLAVVIGRSHASVSGNVIRGGDAGVVIVSGGEPTVAGNDIEVSGRGIAIGRDTSPVVAGNVVCGGDVSINVAEGATPHLGENRICDRG